VGPLIIVGAERTQAAIWLGVLDRILLNSGDIGGLHSFRAFDDVELNLLPLAQGPKALHLDGRMVDENIATATFPFNKTVSLFVVEPFHFAHRHPLTFFLRAGL